MWGKLAPREGLGRELLSKPRPRVARELKHVCRLSQNRVVASQKFGNVVDPLVRIADAAARLERESTDNLASYDLKEALQSLAKVLRRSVARRGLIIYSTQTRGKIIRDEKRTGMGDDQPPGELNPFRQPPLRSWLGVWRPKPLP
jgi:hypothetical protein